MEFWEIYDQHYFESEESFWGLSAINGSQTI